MPRTVMTTLKAGDYAVPLVTRPFPQRHRNEPRRWRHRNTLCKVMCVDREGITLRPVYDTPWIATYRPQDVRPVTPIPSPRDGTLRVPDFS